MAGHSFDELERIRSQMISTALEKGMLAPETIKLSEELDSLMNKLQVVKTEKSNCFSNQTDC